MNNNKLLSFNMNSAYSATEALFSKIKLSAIRIIASLDSPRRKSYFLRERNFLGRELRGGAVEHMRRAFEPCIYKKERVRCDDCEVREECSLRKTLFPKGSSGRKKNAPWIFHFNDWKSLENQQYFDLSFLLFDKSTLINQWRDFLESVLKTITSFTCEGAEIFYQDGFSENLIGNKPSFRKLSSCIARSRGIKEIQVRMISPCHILFRDPLAGKSHFLMPWNFSLEHFLNALFNRIRNMLTNYFLPEEKLGEKEKMVFESLKHYVHNRIKRQRPFVETHLEKIIWEKQNKYLGMIGHFCIRVERGTLDYLVPWLRAGEILHLGKWTSAGAGQIELSVRR